MRLSFLSGATLVSIATRFQGVQLCLILLRYLRTNVPEWRLPASIILICDHGTHFDYQRQ